MPRVLLLLTQSFFYVGEVFINILQFKLRGKANLGWEIVGLQERWAQTRIEVIIKVIFGLLIQRGSGEESEEQRVGWSYLGRIGESFEKLFKWFLLNLIFIHIMKK